MSVEMTIEEIIAHCDRQLSREPKGSIFYREHEAVKAFLIELQEFRNIGMKPEEIKELCTDDVAEVAKMFRKMIESGEINHLQEIIQAEQGGRLVTLPCRAGDTVYEISNNTDACNSCQHYEGIYGSGESWCMQIDDVDLRFYPNIAEKPLCEKQFMEVVAHKPEIDWIFTHRNDFGKTVFLTRAEAEQKLHDIKSELDAAASEHEQED